MTGCILLVFSLVMFALTTAFAQTITIGFTVSRTGALNVDSMEQFRGFELWRDQVNAAGWHQRQTRWRTTKRYAARTWGCSPAPSGRTLTA